MKVSELYEGSKPKSNKTRKLSEAPYSIGSNALDTVSGAVKGVFGGGQAEKGNRDAGKVANAYYKQFMRYIGKRLGTGVAVVPVSLVYKFLVGSKLNPDGLEKLKGRNNVPLEDVERLIFQAVRDTDDEFGNVNVPSEFQRQGQNGTGRTDPTMNADYDEEDVDSDSEDIPSKLSGLSSAELRKLLSLLQ